MQKYIEMCIIKTAVARFQNKKEHNTNTKRKTKKFRKGIGKNEK